MKAIAGHILIVVAIGWLLLVALHDFLVTFGLPRHPPSWLIWVVHLPLSRPAMHSCVGMGWNFLIGLGVAHIGAALVVWARRGRQKKKESEV